MHLQSLATVAVLAVGASSLHIHHHKRGSINHPHPEFEAHRPGVNHAASDSVVVPTPAYTHVVAPIPSAIWNGALDPNANRPPPGDDMQTGIQSVDKSTNDFSSRRPGTKTKLTATTTAKPRAIPAGGDRRVEVRPGTDGLRDYVLRPELVHAKAGHQPSEESVATKESHSSSERRIHGSLATPPDHIQEEAGDGDSLVARDPKHNHHDHKPKPEPGIEPIVAPPGSPRPPYPWITPHYVPGHDPIRPKIDDKHDLQEESSLVAREPKHHPHHDGDVKHDHHDDDDDDDHDDDDHDERSDYEVWRRLDYD